MFVTFRCRPRRLHKSLQGEGPGMRVGAAGDGVPASRAGERAQRVASDVVDRLRDASTPGVAVEALRDACDACFPGVSPAGEDNSLGEGAACPQFLRHAYHEFAVFLVTWAGPEWRESFTDRDRRDVFDRFFGDEVPAGRVAAALLAALHFVASRPRPRRDAVASVVFHLGVFVSDRRDGWRDTLLGQAAAEGEERLEVAPEQVVAWALDVPDALAAAVARSRGRFEGPVAVPRALLGRTFRKGVARIALGGGGGGERMAEAAAGVVGRLCARGHTSVVAGELARMCGGGPPSGGGAGAGGAGVGEILQRITPHALEGLIEGLVRFLARKAASDDQALACLWTAVGELLLEHDRSAGDGGVGEVGGDATESAQRAASAGATVHHLLSHRLLLCRVMPQRSLRWVLLLGILRCRGRTPQGAAVFLERVVDSPKEAFIDVDQGVLAAVEPLFIVWRSPDFASGQPPTTPAQQRYISVALRHVITALGRPSLDLRPKLSEHIIRGVNEWIDNPIVRTRRMGFAMGRAYSVALDPAKPIEFPVDELDGSEGGAFIGDFFDKDWETDPEAWERSSSSSSSDEEEGSASGKGQGSRRGGTSKRGDDVQKTASPAHALEIENGQAEKGRDDASPAVKSAPPPTRRSAIDPDEVVDPFGDEDSEDDDGSGSDGSDPSFPTTTGFNLAAAHAGFDDRSDGEPDSDDDSIESMSMSSDEDDLDPVNLLLPKRLQDIIHGLIKGSDPNMPDRQGPSPRDLTEACLKGAERLVRSSRNAGQVKALGRALLDVLVPLTDTYHLGETKFSHRRSAALTALAVVSPENLVPVLTGYFYAPNLMIATRGEVVEVLVAAASELSELPDTSKHGRSLEEEEPERGGDQAPGGGDDDDEEPYDIYSDPKKTRRWGRRRTADAVPAVNRFHALAPHFALPLMLHYDRAKQAMEATAGGKTGGIVDLQRADFYLLAKVAHAVGHFLACNSRWSPTQGALLPPVLDFLKAVRDHAQAFVRRAAILATYQALSHSHNSYWAEHYATLVDVGEWMLAAAGADTDPECRNASVSTFKLARSHLAQLAPADALELLERQNPQRGAPLIEEFLPE